MRHRLQVSIFLLWQEIVRENRTATCAERLHGRSTQSGSANCLFLFSPRTWATSVSALILEMLLQKRNCIGVFFL